MPSTHYTLTGILKSVNNGFCFYKELNTVFSLEGILLTASMASKQAGQVDIGQLPIPQLNQLVQQLEQVKSPCLFFIQRLEVKFCHKVNSKSN